VSIRLPRTSTASILAFLAALSREARIIPVWPAILMAKNISSVGPLSCAEKCGIDKIIHRNLSLSGPFGVTEVDQFIVEI